MINPNPLSQNDPKWKAKKLGYSAKTIGSYGCTITALTSLARGSDVSVTNDILKANNGYAANGAYYYPAGVQTPEKNLVIWDKVSTIPNLRFKYRYYTYDNTKVSEIIKNNGACLVEVDGAPIGGYRHWLLYIGDQKLIDPWDGKVKPTSSYKAISFVDIEYTQEQIPMDLNNDLLEKYNVKTYAEFDAKVEEHVGVTWGDANKDGGGYLASERRKNEQLQKEVDSLEKRIEDMGAINEQNVTQLNKQSIEIGKFTSVLKEKDFIIGNLETELETAKKKEIGMLDPTTFGARKLLLLSIQAFIKKILRRS